MALHKITVGKNDSKSLESRFVIQVHKQIRRTSESTNNGATINDHASIYPGFRLKACRNDSEVGAEMTALWLAFRKRIFLCKAIFS